MNDWKTTFLSFWGKRPYFQGAFAVSFRECFPNGYDESGITPEPRDAGSWQIKSFQQLAGDDGILGGK